MDGTEIAMSTKSGRPEDEQRAQGCSKVGRVTGRDLAVLVDEARNGNDAAFEEIVRLTYDDTYTLAVRLTGDPEDARDVVQEAYIRAHRGLARFRGDAHFSTWLFRITANCANTIRGRRRRHNHDQLPDEGGLVEESRQSDPGHRLDIGVLRSQLTQAVVSLPPKLRSVLVLRDVYELSHEAIAQELGITTSAAKVRLHRARKRLREVLGPGRSPDDDEDSPEAATNDGS